MADATTAAKKTASANNKSKNATPGSGSINWLALIGLLLAVLACVGVGFLFWKSEQNASAMQSMRNTNQTQLAAMQAQADQLEQLIQTSQDADQKQLQKALAQINDDQSQAVKQVALNSALYLTRLANLALIINRDPAMGEHMLDLAQQRLAKIPSLENLRAAIMDKKEKIAAIPDMDMDGVLMQLGSLKKVVMTLQNVPHWTVTTTKQSTTNSAASGVEKKAVASWDTFWHWLQRFIIISHRDSNNDVLPTPEHFQSVQDSVFLGLSTAQWAVLHENTQVYQHALTSVVSQLQSIQQSDPKVVANLLQDIQKLAKTNINPDYPQLGGLVSDLMQAQTATAAQTTTEADQSVATQTTTQANQTTASKTTESAETTTATPTSKKTLKQMTQEVLA